METGQMTPSEFLIAGDSLVKCNPLFTWKAAASKRMSVAHLPVEQQYLFATKLPSYNRVADLRVVDNLQSFSQSGLPGDDGYCLPVSSITIKEEENVVEDDIVIVHDYDKLASKGTSTSIDVRGRTGCTREAKDERFYTLCITYDKFYRTPRVFFYGNDRNGGSLSSEAMFEDVFRDYSGVVSLEPFPHTGKMMMRIHPCQHASAMRNIIKTLVDSNSDYRPSVEHYLLVFLKIIACVVPGMEYDHCW